MKRKAAMFFAILAISALCYGAIASAAVILFRNDGADPLRTAVIAGTIGAAFFVLAILVVGRHAKPYGLDYAALEAQFVEGKPGKGYEKAMKDLGSAPLVSLIEFFVLSIAFSTGLVAASGGLGGRNDLLIFCLSFGMLGASFAYVQTDRLVLRTLLECRVVHYPPAIREKRQQRKTLIIPLFMAIMSLLFAVSSYSILGTHPDVLGIGFLPSLLALFVLYFGTVVALLVGWNTNTALLYKSVIIQLEQLSSKEKNLSSRISIGSVDEIGTISGMVNSFCEGLSSGVRDIAATYSDLASVQKRLFDGIGMSSAAAGDIASSIESALSAIQKADDSLSASLRDAESLARHVSEAAGKTREQAGRVASSTSGIESIMSAVERLARDAEGARRKTVELGQSVRQGEEGVRSVVENVSAVAERSADLQEINKLIAAVASRTNLLAMNAAIEAAHAGAAGAGFSVVAEEIRTLAESTADHTRRSKESLQAILGLIERSLSSAEAAGTSFVAIREAAEAVESLSSQVATSMTEEGARSGSILGLLAETGSLGHDIAETTKALDGLTSAMNERLSAAAAAQSEARRLAETMKLRNGELSHAMIEVDSLAAKTAELNSTLASFLSSFRT